MNYKREYYIGIVSDDGTIKFVTAIDNSTRSCNWEAGKPALKMARGTAEDICYGLLWNGFKAGVYECICEGYELKNP